MTDDDEYIDIAAAVLAARSGNATQLVAWLKLNDHELPAPLREFLIDHFKPLSKNLESKWIREQLVHAQVTAEMGGPDIHKPKERQEVVAKWCKYFGTTTKAYYNYMKNHRWREKPTHTIFKF